MASEIVAATPYRIFTLLIFLAAVVHTLLANHFSRLSRRVQARHSRKETDPKKKVSFLAEVLYFFGEIEIVFALWVIPLVIVTTIFYSWEDMVEYLNSRVYVEPFFVVVMMSLASSRPIIKLAKKGVHAIAQFFGDSIPAWWLTIMTLGPIMGSFITEPAAMAISALIMRDKLYTHNPSKKLAYGTLGLMFVNFSVCGILTNFAAPPALTLSRCLNWDLSDFFGQFGLQVFFGLFLVNTLYFWLLRNEFKKLPPITKEDSERQRTDLLKGPVPIWITLVHITFLIWTIIMAHYPPVFLGSYLLYLGFNQATRLHQYKLNLKRPLMVGVFLAGLVIHGGFQGWWIEPLIGDLGYGALMVAGMVLTAFNENTTVAVLACLLDDIGPKLQYAIVSGLVAGGGLTIIAHAPNPVGQSFLRKHFKGGVSPWNLFLGALLPSLIFLLIFYFFPPRFA